MRRAGDARAHRVGVLLAGLALLHGARELLLDLARCPWRASPRRPRAARPHSPTAPPPGRCRGPSAPLQALQPSRSAAPLGLPIGSTVAAQPITSRAERCAAGRFRAVQASEAVNAVLGRAHSPAPDRPPPCDRRQRSRSRWSCPRSGRGQRDRLRHSARSRSRPRAVRSLSAPRRPQPEARRTIARSQR